MFRTRLISGIILVAVSLVAITAGGAVLACVLLAVSLIGQRELYQALKIKEKAGRALPLSGCFCTVFYYAMLYFSDSTYTKMALVFSLTLLMAVYVFLYPRCEVQQVAEVFLGVVYVAVLLSFVYQLRIRTDGGYLVWLIFLASWGCDTCAYCVGKAFGRHKMAARLSPKKTVEGAVGGVAGAGILGALYALAVQNRLSFQNDERIVPVFALICAIGALISMVGDLAASAVKRNCGIKDYGSLIPGHGGILDRFDSVIFIAPVIYYLLLILEKL